MARRIPGYAVFSDESRHTQGRFRSIAALSLPANVVVRVSRQIQQIIKRRKITEFKWNRLRKPRYRKCAIELIDYLFAELLPRDARVDVVVWDTEDARHSVAERDDLKNYERMFYHLHRNVMQRRQPGESWHLRPDEGLDVDWDTIRSCLSSTGKRRQPSSLLRREAGRSLRVATLRQVDSEATPLCQLVDLFAGIAPYSRMRAHVYRQLQEDALRQESLFPGRRKKKPSNADRERFLVISHLYDACRKKNLGVSLQTLGYLKTLDPQNIINFWHYEPQHHHDRAPTRSEPVSAT